jgi:amino acid adenylation domain-containing protein
MDSAVGRNLVKRWRAGGESAVAPAPGPAPISKEQRGALIFERLCPGSAVFNLRFAVRHAGQLDEERLDSALSVLLRRYPALRGTFVDGDDGPVRLIQDFTTLRTQWIDLRHLPPERRRTAALEHAARVAAEPFDLARGPLVRVHGYRLADDEHMLVFLAHHLVCDGGSMRVLLSELEAAYSGFEFQGVAADPAPAPADPSSLEYWLTRLADLPELDLLTDHARPAQPTFEAGSVPLTMSAELVAAAEQLARSEDTTLFTVLLTAFQLLLAVHSEQTDFAVGAPEAGRSQPGLHGAVGLMSDALVLRADLSGRPSFRDLVRRARATCLAALAHRGVPFEELVAALAPGRHLHGALVRATIAFQGDWGQPTLAGSPLEQVAVARPGIRSDVEVHLWRNRGGLWGTWDYSAETFEPTTAARMAERLPVLLARALAEPDRPVDGLDLLTDQDRALLASWGRGPEPEDPDVSLVDLFAAQVARTPDAIAIEDARRELTYRQLDQSSNQLAHYLCGRDVQAGDIVGIRLGRSVDMVVAMLGILKAGAAYVPLDPAWPADRTDYMLRDSSARVVVTDAELDALDGQPASGEGIGRVPPDRLAYVLYTSGSTGRPKGVLLTHGNAASMVLWVKRNVPPEHLSKALASTSICFDVSVFEIFGTLCAGGTVVVVDNALALLANPPDVTMVFTVPAAASALAAAGALPRSTRVVYLGGEAVAATLVEALYANGHVEEVVNFYGPTEDTTFATYAKVFPGEQPPPIGAVASHEHVYVLDAALRPVPVGAIGELYLAGRGLTRGYLNQPALTASRYVAHPYTATPGERMYRTGDLVRYRADGALLYLGRRDFQVKVRGHRIELGEIEDVLQRHPQVSEAVAALHDGWLVGYLTARQPDGIDLDDLRAYLRRMLPIVMIPSRLVVLDALPKTPSGKVDRAVLPAPVAPIAADGDPPRGAHEELVADVWREVLDLDTVGRDDDFFDLGGDSLKVGEVLSRLRERAGGEIPLMLVFENSRLADLAAALPTVGSSPGGNVVPARSPDAKPVLSFEQQRIWLECQLKATVAYNMHGSQWLRGPLDVPALERSIRAVIDRHESLRTTFPVAGGLPVQRVAEPDPCWRITVEDLSGSRSGGAAAAERLADAQAAVPFDLTAGPLFRCLLVRLSETEHLLSMTVHHIISDGQSVRLILRELSALYQVGGDIGRTALPPLPVQYQDYAVWQRNTLTGEHLATAVDYWRERLAGAPPALALPTARRRSPSADMAGGKVRTALGADAAAAVHKLCRVHGVTPFMAMLAALATVLRRWSGQDDLVIGVPVNTRAAANTEALVGLFVNTVPLRIELTGDPAFSEVLDRVRRVAVDGYVNHAETPFEILVGELRPARDPSRTPLFQVVLNMIEDVEDEWRLRDIVVEKPRHPAQPSMFDLALDVRHIGDDYRLELLYHGERFEASVMRALLDQFAAMLAAAADDPSRGILEYELQSPGCELPSAGGDDTGAPPAPPAPDLDLARQARQRPDQIAVVDSGGTWSFRQFATAIAAVADLAGRAAPGAVTVVRRQSAGFAVAVLGCAQAGVPYMVIEPDDGRPGSVVFDPKPAAGADGAVVDVGELLRRAAQSTDQTAGAAGVSGLTGDDRVAVLTGDAGLTMCALSTALAVGAVLAVAGEATGDDPDALATWLRDTAATSVYLTGPLLRRLAGHPAGIVLPLLQDAFLDNRGDLTAHDVEQMRRLAPGCRVTAIYRPTAEGAPLAVYEVPPTWSPSTAPLRVPIGREFADRPVSLLNPAGRPAAVGEAGELCVGSVRTTDIVRRRPDGLLEFAGLTGGSTGSVLSADLLETVAVLRDLPDVHDAVVTEYLEAAGQAELAAYVACRDSVVDLSRLRQHLVTHLPEYLIPRRVVTMERLPLTAAGDYDLAELPDPAMQ